MVSLAAEYSTITVVGVNPVTPLPNSPPTDVLTFKVATFVLAVAGSAAKALLSAVTESVESRVNAVCVVRSRV